MIELQESPQTSLVEDGVSSSAASSRSSRMAGPTMLAGACCFLIYMLQMVGLAKIPPHMYDVSSCAVVPWLHEQMLLRFYFTISEVAYLPSFAWALVEMLRSAAVDLRMQTRRWSTYTALMSSLFLLCFFQLMNRILLDTMGKDYVNGKNNNDPVAILGMVMESFLSFLMQCRLFAYADHIMDPGNSSWKPPAASRACVLLSASFLGLRSYHVGVLLLGHKPNFWLSTSARFGRIFFRLLMGGAHAVRAKAYAGHALSDTLSSQMRCNMATLSEMMLVSAVLATSVDLVVVVKGLIAPEIFSADFTDYEMDTLNDLFTQWLPITLLITGTIDKRAPQPHINDLRACGFTNGLVLFFLYLGTFLFGAWGARAVLFATTPAAKKLAQLGGGPLALAKAGAGMMYFAMPALFASVFPFTVNLVHKATKVSMPMWPGEGLTFITYHRNAAHLFALALVLHAAGHIWSFAKAGSVEDYTTLLWHGDKYTWLWPWMTGVFLVVLGLSLYVAYWGLKRQCYDFFIRNKRVLGSVLLVLAAVHGFSANFGSPRLWWFVVLILCMWLIDRNVKRSGAEIRCSQQIIKMLNAKWEFNGAILVLRSQETFQEAEPGAVLLQVVGVNGRHPLTQIAYPAGRNRWQLEFHIRLQPNAEKQNWAHRLYDHARAREGTDEGILLEVAGPMSTLGTFGQEELLRDVHRVVFVAIGVGFTGCIHPLFHAHEAHIRPEHIRFCCRTPSAEYGDVLEPVCSAYGLRRGHELKISVSDGPAKEGEKQSRSEWNEMLTTEVNALSPGGHGLVLLFCCGPSPAVRGVQNLFLDDMRVRMVAEAFG